MKSQIGAALAYARTLDAAARKGTQYARQQAWSADHMHTASCRLTDAEHAALLDACNRAHVTRYALIRGLILAYLEISRR